MPFPALELHDALRFLLLLGAMLVDALLGDLDPAFRRMPHPIAVLGRAIAWLETRLNRHDRGPRARFERGLLVVVLLSAAAVALGLGLEALAGQWRFGWVIELMVVALLLAQRSLFDHVVLVRTALARDGLKAGRRAVARIVGRDPDALDAHAVARAAIESLAENFSDAVVGPALWYLLLGLPGILLHKCINTLDSMIGHRTPRYRRFGAAAAYSDTALNFVPARLAAVLIALAAVFVPAAAPWQAMKVALRDAYKHRSVNAGWPEAAMAGALGIALAGPRRYQGEAVADAWLGTEFTARATPAHIRQALVVYAVACILGFVLVALAMGLVVARASAG